MDKIELEILWTKEPIQVTVKSIIDVFNSDSAKAEFQKIAEKADRNVLLDFSTVDFIDSTSIAAIVQLYKKLRCNDLDLLLVGLQEQPYGLLALLGMDKIISCAKA